MLDKISGVFFFCNDQRLTKGDFCRIPKAPAVKSKWLEAIDLENIPKTAKVCSLHFKDSDWSPNCSKRRRLKLNAVPFRTKGIPHVIESSEALTISNTIEYSGQGLLIDNTDIEMSSMMGNDIGFSQPIGDSITGPMIHNCNGIVDGSRQIEYEASIDMDENGVFENFYEDPYGASIAPAYSNEDDGSEELLDGETSFMISGISEQNPDESTIASNTESGPLLEDLEHTTKRSSLVKRNLLRITREDFVDDLCWQKYEKHVIKKNKLISCLRSQINRLKRTKTSLQAKKNEESIRKTDVTNKWAFGLLQTDEVSL